MSYLALSLLFSITLNGMDCPTLGKRAVAQCFEHVESEDAVDLIFKTRGDGDISFIVAPGTCIRDILTKMEKVVTEIEILIKKEPLPFISQKLNRYHKVYHAPSSHFQLLPTQETKPLDPDKALTREQLLALKNSTLFLTSTGSVYSIPLHGTLLAFTLDSGRHLPVIAFSGETVHNLIQRIKHNAHHETIWKDWKNAKIAHIFTYYTQEQILTPEILSQLSQCPLLRVVPHNGCTLFSTCSHHLDNSVMSGDITVAPGMKGYDLLTLFSAAFNYRVTKVQQENAQGQLVDLDLDTVLTHEAVTTLSQSILRFIREPDVLAEHA